MESILKMTDLQLVRRYNMKIIAFLVCHITGLRNVLALKATPQASVMAWRTAWHRSRQVAGWGSSSASQDRQEAPLRLSSWVTSAVNAPPSNPLHNNLYATTYPSAVHLRIKTVADTPKAWIERRKKAPVIQTRQKLFQKVGSLLA